MKDDRLSTGRSLGNLWDLERDELVVRVQIPKKQKTKRGLLSIASSIYNPLRLITPSIIRAKIIRQDECRRGVGWDERMAKQNKVAWRRWLDELPHLSRVHVPRCYRPQDANPVAAVQLHHFCDASQLEYGAVSYLRTTCEDGTHHISFMRGKAKLDPLKQQTIPRLEL
ncbi:uncharacterized protein LOC121880274 [Homarus americanus]|uniref:uncharacterized protein LOC121880274 n=1 Tax=Homarus americanus TaxID=6706 RepID=UPI001C4968C9|nr:uncharacterized protein LOC121880274 [Homarus americanus]